MIQLFHMVKKNILIIFSFLGIIGSIVFSNVYGNDKEIKSSHISSPPSSPYKNTISGLGFVEASSGNINIGAFTPGIVSGVLVKEGDAIKRGQILFTQDSRSAEANLKIRRDELEIAKSNFEFSKLQLEDLTIKFNRALGLKSGNNISDEEVISRRFAVEKAKIDIKIKQELINQAESNLNLSQIELDKTAIGSPIDGIVLKVRIHPGEFISGNEQDSNSPMLIGSIDPLYLRVQIDENDLWRFNKDKPAYAYLRSNQEIKTPLSFVRIEPFAGSKEKLKGTGSELIDTRIVDIIYKIDNHINNLYIGQQLDVFIETDMGI